MNTHTPFRSLALSLLALSLLSLSSCHDDSLPTPPATEQPPAEETTDLLDAYHDKTRTQPYPKSDNELYLNPSPLIVPLSMKTGERLLFALSRSADFSTPETLLSEPLKWCVFNPHRKLEAGIWYWRFRQADADGTPQGDWSTTYQFEVKDDTPVFVTPPFSEFQNHAPHDYPRLYCYLDASLSKARLNVKSHAEYKQLLSRAQTALTTDFSTGNANEQAATMKLHIQWLYDAYHLTRQPQYLERMHQQLRWLLASPVNDALLFSSNFNATDIAVCYVQLYDQLYTQLSPDERLGAEDIMMRVLRFYAPRQYGAQENHIFDNHFWQQNLRVLFQCALLLHDRPAYAAEVLPMIRYYYEIWTARAPASGFNRDGVWHNGSGYFSTNLKTLHYMPMLFSYVTGTDFLQHPWYHNAGRFMVYTCPPHSKSSGFGDGSEINEEPDRQRVAFADFLARELNDSYAGWYASECGATLQSDYEMRLYRMCATRSYNTSLSADAAKMVWYQDAGEVVMHSRLKNTKEDVNLSFRSSTFGSGSHTTSSQNAFNLLYKGKEVYRSSGYYQNFSDAHNLMSYRHTRAHNTLLVNGIGQPYSTHAYGNVMRALEGEHITYCLGDASKAYCGISDDPMWVSSFENAGITQTPENGFGETPLTKYRRHVLMLHPEGIVVIYDELEASEPVTYDWLLHSPSRISINPATLTASHTDSEAGLSAVTRLFCNDATELSVTDQFAVAPAEPAPNQWHMTARITGKAKTRIAAVIQVMPAGTSPKTVYHYGDRLVIGSWTITPQLDASQPAALKVSHSNGAVCFSYGSDNPKLNGTEYQRKYGQSSLLYDNIGGTYQVEEQTDRLPASTRVK